MSKVTIKEIDSTIENQITTAMIISTKFLSEVLPLFDKEYLRNSFAKIICFWCVDYFKQYKKAPGIHIKDIFNMESELGMTSEDKEIIGTFLSKLNKQYVEDQGINSDYIRDNAFNYFKQRELEIRVDKASKLLKVGKVEEAEEQFTKFKKIAYQVSGWFNPFEASEVMEVFDDTDTGIFLLPGALGQVMGPIERDWFIAVLAPFKKGKTWFLQEMAVRAIFQRLKVVFISLEMKKKNIKERLYKRVTGFGSKSGEDVFLYPVFDCELNQTGECERPERANQITLRTANGEKPDFDLDMEYRPCSYCRTNMIMDYRLETWYETIEIPQFSFSSTRKQLSALSRMYGDNLRVISYPRFTASISDIRRDLYILEQHDEFIPDVIIVDYADILKPDSSKGKKLDDIDDIWKMLASMAAEKHCIVFTASQGTRGSIYKSDMSQDDLAEWIGKLGHVDLFLGLNQTKDEKRSKIIRVNGLVHRHKEIDESVFACLLQQLETGQFCMDSHLMRR
jgi:replicative DNA helicase